MPVPDDSGPRRLHRLTGVEVFEEHLRDTENTAHPSFYDSTAHYEMHRDTGARSAAAADCAARGSASRLGRRSFSSCRRCLVTIRPSDSLLVPQIRERILDAARYNQRVPAIPEELMLRLLSGLVDRYLDLRQPLTAQLETWQRNLLNPRRPFKDWTTLLEARMELHKLQHLSEEQLDAIQEWRDERLEQVDRAEHPAQAAAREPINDLLNVRITDLVGHIQRVLTHARNLESSIDSAVQLHFSATAFRTAEIMRVLTVLSAIFMPLTLVTGIFGMNFESIPFIHSPGGFWLTIGAMGLIGIVMVAIFTARRYVAAPLPRRAARRKAEEIPQ